jgi:hypothetical protein
MPSLVVEIGYALEIHLKMIGLIKVEEIYEHRKKFLAEKRMEFETGTKPKWNAAT